jgi:signal transduction histidine kinase
LNSPSSTDAAARKPEPHARAAYYQALASIFARDRVLSVASHDLRSPLNGIHSWIYVLESKVGSADPTVQRALAGLRAGVEQQVKIIEEVIDATRVQSKSLPLAKAHAALAPLIEDVVANLRTTFASERAAFIEVTPLPPHAMLDADGERLMQALWVALAYAVDASPPGSTVTLHNRLADGAWCATIGFRACADTLSDPSLPHAFESLLRSPNVAPARDGIPLAVSLTRRVAEAHNGKLATRMTGDGATELVFTVPQA